MSLKALGQEGAGEAAQHGPAGSREVGEAVQDGAGTSRAALAGAGHQAPYSQHPVQAVTQTNPTSLAAQPTHPLQAVLTPPTRPLTHSTLDTGSLSPPSVARG